jgi:hypothetical protein
MALPRILTSVHGVRLGLSQTGRLIVGALNPGVAPLVVYTNEAASTAISNSTTETLFSTQYSVPAKPSVPASSSRSASRASRRPPTAPTRWRSSSTSAASPAPRSSAMAATDVADNNVFEGEYEVIMRTVGASGTMVGTGTFKSVPAAEGTATYKDDILASTAIDTTVAQVIGVSATWSVASASNSVRLDFMRVEIA